MEAQQARRCKLARCVTVLTLTSVPSPFPSMQEEMRRRGEDVDPSVMFDSNCITPGAY